MQITTPAILFPAISLLFLSYTNKFLAIANLIRQLNVSNNNEIKNQIKNLNKRISLLKYMQLFGILSFIFCLGSMLFIYIDFIYYGVIVFGTSMILLSISLLIAFWEISISTHAIKLELNKIQK